MELLDLCTAAGVPTGERVPRETAHQKGLWHRTIHCWMRNGAGELLLQKRSAAKETHPGLWDISCAGHLSAGDDSLSGVIREAREELGLMLDPEGLRFLFTLAQHWESPDRSVIENEIKDVFLYTLPVEIDDLRPDPVEVSGVRFISIDRLKRCIAENCRELVPHDEEYRRLFALLEET